MNKWIEIEKEYYMPTFARFPIILVKGEGNYVWDDKGNKYLDLVAGWAVNSLGHCHPVITEAVTRQVNTLIHTSNSYYTIPQLELASLLVNISCFDKVFFCNSGTEATEGAVKLARRFGHLYLNGAYEVITTTGSFHGRTLAMVSASGQMKYQAPYTPLPSGFVNVEFNNFEAIKQATNQKTCAIMLEPIQGEGGVNVAGFDYLRQIRQWCDEKGILLILDEIQTGIGRTGKLFAFQHSSIEPDIMTLAKGMASGIPIGAIMAKNRASVFSFGEHGSTFGGNPLACAAALAVISYIINNNLCEHATSMGNMLAARLKDFEERFDLVQSSRGMGLLQALIFNQDVAADITLKCLEKGLLINKLKPNALRFMPSLVISDNELKQALDILEEVIGSF